MAQARSSRPRERIARAALLLASAILGSLPVAALASVPYDAILEWNGPYFHVKNAPTVDQLVDTPSHDIPFLSPFAVAARPHGSRNVVYVLDTGHNRVQFFEANARFVHADQTAFTWRQSGAIAASQWNSVRINLAEWAASANHWVIPFSETLIVNGVAWRRVADLGNFTAADHVYTIDYSAPANAPSLIFPVGSLVQTDVFSLEYAISDNETGAPSAFGIGDVDYGIGAGSAPILGKIDQSSGGPASWQQVRAIALIPDEADSTADDIFLVDAADNSTARNEKLFEYRVTNAGSVAYVGSYDDSLRAPASAVAARSGASDPATAGLAGGPGPFSSAVVSDPAEVTGHTYDVSVAGSAVSITDRTTGRVLISSAAFSDLADPFLAVPGLSLSKAGSAGADMAITTVRAVCNRYLLVTDTGDNRIKVISAGGGAPGEWPGNWLAGRSHTGRPQPSGADQVGATADIDYDNVTPSPVPEDYGVYTSAYPIKEGTLLSITFDPDGTPSVWTQVPGMDAAGPTDRVYELDWPSGRITFGDGVHGRIPPAGTAFRFDCVTSPDVLRYGSSGASAGRFAAPTGIAARWNETTGAFDVYVADSGNNRIQKLAFHPDRPDLRLPARVDFLCQWNTGASDADTLVDPVDLDVALDRQRSGTGQTCYLAVADQGNHRLLVYRDAAATTGGGTAVPAFDFVTGAAGDTLGSFSGISGIRFVPDGDALDLFTADTSRGEITKFQESPAPSLTLLFAGPSALPRSFPTSSSYPFSFIPRNPPAGGWIDFYYDTSSTFNISTSRLCITSGTVPATATSAVWSFLDSPGGVPPDHAGYYLFARMKDPSGALVASDQTGPDRLLGVDSLLVPTLRVTNALDESSTLLLQNGLSRIVNLEVAYPESVIAIGFAGTFDTSLVQITGITPGTPWDGLGGTASFNQDFSNVSGSFEVSSSVTSAPTGLSAPDSRVVARIVFKARPHAITLRTPHREGEIQLVSSGSGITDIHGRSPDELWAESLGLRVAYLGDIATTGAAPDSTPPHLVPHPDGTIDFSDRMLFTIGWNGASHVRDPIADLGPASGTAPDLVSSPDGNWNVEDIMAFTTMFSWSAAQENLSKSLVPVPDTLAWSAVSGNAQVYTTCQVGDGSDPGTTSPSGAAPPLAPGTPIRIDLGVSGVQNLAGAHLLLLYDPDQLDLTGVQDGGFLRGADGGLFFPETGPGRCEIMASRLDHSHPGLDGAGTVARLGFKILRTPSSPLRLCYDLRSAAGGILARGIHSSEALAGNGPSFRLLVARPNPAPGRTDFLFSLDDTSPVTLSLFDPTGRRLRVLVDGRLGPGVHILPFDGRDDRGNRLPSGTYFYTLGNHGSRQSGKLVLLP